MSWHIDCYFITREHRRKMIPVEVEVVNVKEKELIATIIKIFLRNGMAIDKDHNRLL